MGTIEGFFWVGLALAMMWFSMMFVGIAGFMTLFGA